MGELGKNFGLNILWEEVGEDALQSIPRQSYALPRQVTTQLKNIESVCKMILRFLAQSVLLTHFPCWGKSGFRQ
jgi:hypothetical protein